MRAVQIEVAQADQTELRSGDVLRAFNAVTLATSQQRQNKRVRVEGEVLRPGDYLMPADSTLADALKAAGYPAKADPAQINYFMTLVLLVIMLVYVTMVYGPIAAFLVELFPTRIRYTSMSLPYHIGNGWFGGFLPTTAFAIVAASGDIYAGLWYPVIIASATVLIGLVLLPETNKRDIDA